MCVRKRYRKEKDTSLAVTESQTPSNEVEKLLLPSEDSRKDRRMHGRTDGQKEKEALKELLPKHGNLYIQPFPHICACQDSDYLTLLPQSAKLASANTVATIRHFTTYCRKARKSQVSQKGEKFAWSVICSQILFIFTH